LKGDDELTKVPEWREEIKKRFDSWVKPDVQKDPFVKGWMKQYALSVGSPSKGALIDLSFKS
jgi:hypothetical protein